MFFALIPLRQGKRLRNKKKTTYKDYISLCQKKVNSTSYTSLPNVGKHLVVGRQEMLSCLYAACGCDSNIYSTKNKCTECQKVNRWAPYALSRQMLSFSSLGEAMALRCRGNHASVVVMNSHVGAEKKSRTSYEDDVWSGSEKVDEGTIIRVSPRQEKDMVLEFEVILVDDITKGEDVKSSVPMYRETMKNLALDRNDDHHVETPTTSLIDSQPATQSIDIVSIRQQEVKLDSSLKRKKTEPRQTEVVEEFDIPLTSSDQSSQQKSAAQPASRHMNHAKSQRFGGSDKVIPTDNHHVEGLSSSQSCQQSTNNGKIPANPQVLSFPDPNLRHRGDVKVPNFSRHCYVYFCQLGQDLPRQRIQILSRIAVEKGAKVVSNYRVATHMVISELVDSLQEVAQQIGITEDQLSKHLDENDIHCVIPMWVTANEKILDVPNRMQAWLGYLHHKRRRTDDDSRRQDLIKRRQRAQMTSLATAPERNSELAQLFRKLSKLHQSSPLLPMDEWKAYCFSVVSGRLKNLDFEIINDPQILDRVKQIKGIGSTSFDMIREFLETGIVTRVKEFESDRKRQAMRKMMSIWGVGRVKASELVRSGFCDIHQVRRAIKTMAPNTLDRNQLVGVECYEDFLEEMARDEVEAIGLIIEQTCKARFPGVEVTIMGSYRRGSKSCGDVDVHITHRDFWERIPNNALGRIIDSLWQKGHIAFHLTFLTGITTGCKCSDDKEFAKFIPKEAWESNDYPMNKTTSRHDDLHSAASYMGVFNSPTLEGKRRRVDIKFYPYRERIFAALYFTGNGHFNRSMRLWATRKHNLTLNDHGLFRLGTKVRIMDASTEKEVFSRLKLVYKEPNARDCFDAVVPIEERTKTRMEMTEADFYKDSNYIWVD